MNLMCLSNLDLNKVYRGSFVSDKKTSFLTIKEVKAYFTW